MIETWKQFINGQPLLSAPARPILESWQRCKAFDVATAQSHLRRVPLPELKERLEREATLVKAAEKHLAWALAAMAPLLPVIVILTDRDGIVLYSVGNAPEAMVEFGLVPGYDWSERAMGTNGLGTAILFGAPVAVIGAEHYSQTWHNNTCVGAPVRGPDGEIRGAVDICTMAADGDPARLVLIAFVAHVIGLELGRPRDQPYTTDDLLERASVLGSSELRRDLENGARVFAGLESDLMLTTRGDGVDVASKEPTALAPLLQAVAESVPQVRVQNTTSALVEMDAPALCQRAMAHLCALLARGGGGPIEITTREDGPSVVIGIHRSSACSPPATDLDRAGSRLGEWLSTQLLAVSDATLARDETPDRPGYLLRVKRRAGT